jgi:hypothetical protein
MATPTQTQQYGGGNPYPTPASQSGAPSAQQQSAYPTERTASSGTAPYQQNQQQGQQQQQQAPAPPQFEKYCIIHIATTCDEHGVYVTKDSAEVIEIGWVVVDAQNPEREVRLLSCFISVVHTHTRNSFANIILSQHSCTVNLSWSDPSTLPSHPSALRSPP